MITARNALLGQATTLVEEDAFFAKLRLPNGTYKTTASGRMRDLDAWLIAQLPAMRPLKVLDAAVSSGTTTADLLGALAEHAVTTDLTAFDLCADAYLRRTMLASEMLLDKRGNVLQLVTPLFVRGRPHDPLGSPIRATLQGLISAAGMMARAGGVVPRQGDVPVKLVSRRLREYSGVHVVEHDLSVRRADWHQQFHVVRAANILHRDYFNDETLRGMLAHLQSYLIDGGLLLVARTTDDGVNTATLFRKRGGQTPELVGRFGTGSDIEALALTVPAPTA